MELPESGQQPRRKMMKLSATLLALSLSVCDAFSTTPHGGADLVESGDKVKGKAIADAFAPLLGSGRAHDT